MNFSSRTGIERLALALARGARMELYLTPKPGLVDLADNGSHPDLSVPIMERSIGIVEDYLGKIVASLQSGAPFPQQQAIAQHTERRLHDELGTNTHKGYLFLSGMLLIARHRAGRDNETAVRQALSAECKRFFEGVREERTHGARVRQRFNVGGIVHEAVDGYPSLFEEALPVFRATWARYDCQKTASLAMMARLMQVVDDTTTLHRGGTEGMERVRRDGRQLERMIGEGDDFLSHLEELNRDYKTLNLTIGGVADLLGLAFGWLLMCDEIAWDSNLSRGMACSV